MMGGGGGVDKITGTPKQIMQSWHKNTSINKPFVNFINFVSHMSAVIYEVAFL